MFKLIRDINSLLDLLFSGRCDTDILSEKAVEVGRRVVEPSKDMPEPQLKVAVENKAIDICNKAKGTPTEYYEAEALGMILDETNGYHIKPQIKRIHAILDFAGSGKTILDCAGGSGYIANLLKNQGNDVTVLDYSQIHLLRAKWLRKLKTAHGRAENIPFPDHSFDIVLMGEILEHVEKMSVPLAEAERVCKEDGQIIVTVPVCAHQDIYHEHVKSIRHKFIDDEKHENEMLVLSIKNIIPHLKDFREKKRNVVEGNETKSTNMWTLPSLSNIVIRGMHGLGDNIGQRNFIKELPFTIYLETPWPQLYSDLPNVKLIECNTYWRTQQKNLLSFGDYEWAQLPQNRGPELKVMYDNEDLQGDGSIFKKMSDIFGGVIPKTFDMPEFKNIVDLPKDTKIAVIRPVIQRSEWFSTSRNPDPTYIYEASRILKEAGYFIVSVCDLEKDKEWIEGVEPIADIKFHKGELSTESLLGLIQAADVLVGPPGMLIHASLATKVPMLVVYGGYGGCNAPEKIADSRYVDTSCLTHLVPDNFCLDQNMGCKVCVKTISDFPQKVQTWLNTLKV